MANVQIQLDVSQWEKILADLRKKSEQIDKRSAAFAGILSANVYQDINDHFDKQMGPTGPWRGWSEAYAKHARARGQVKILQDTGRLRQAFKPTSYRASMDGITWFNDATTRDGFPYAYAHNEGGPILPRREFMWISDRAMLKIEDQIAKWLAGD